jgi:hypothetical protein
MSDAQLEELLNTRLYPHVYQGLERLRKGVRLVHYTTAENGLNIIKGKSLWMRNCTVMNDFSEVQHGTSCLAAALDSSVGKDFRDWVAALFPHVEDFGAEAFRTFAKQHDQIKFQTYILSLSEHRKQEDKYGRLSMWRAYGAPRSVALVLNPKVVMEQSGYFQAQASPVLYKDTETFTQWFGQWVSGLKDITEHLKRADPEVVTNQLFEIFRVFVLTVKHPAFREEREWRVVHTWGIDAPPPMDRIHVVSSGLPQAVLRIRLENVPEHGVTGLAIPELIHKVILGPMDHPGPASEAYVHALTEAGVADPISMVQATHIPLRQ